MLRRIPGRRPAPYKRLGTAADARFDVIRGYLRFFGPAPVKAIATYLDSPMSEVTAHLPADAVEVTIAGLDAKVKRYALADDVDALAGAADHATAGVVRLVGSHDPYLQLRDRDLLVPDAPRQKDLWRTLGRPGAVLVDGEVAATWRPRASGRSLTIRLDSVDLDRAHDAQRRAAGGRAPRRPPWPHLAWRRHRRKPMTRAGRWLARLLTSPHERLPRRGGAAHRPLFAGHHRRRVGFEVEVLVVAE